MSAFDLLDPDLTGLTAGAIYAIVFGLVFVESGLLIGFWLPGDTVLFTAGLLAGRPDQHLSVALLAVGAGAAAFAGNLVGYASGRRLGRPWLERRNEQLGHSVERAETFFARWGAGAVVAARFVPWLRTFVPILAGVGRMRRVTFAGANLVGALVWGAGLVVIGYAAHSHPAVRIVAYVVAGVAITASIAGSVVARRRARPGFTSGSGPS